MHNREDLFNNWMEQFLDSEEQSMVFSLKELNEAYIEMTNYPGVDHEWVEAYLEASGYTISEIVPFTAEALNQEWRKIYLIGSRGELSDHRALKNLVLSRAS